MYFCILVCGSSHEQGLQQSSVRSDLSQTLIKLKAPDNGVMQIFSLKMESQEGHGEHSPNTVLCWARPACSFKIKESQ